MDVNDWRLDFGGLLLRAALAAPVILMAWLISGATSAGKGLRGGRRTNPELRRPGAVECSATVCG